MRNLMRQHRRRIEFIALLLIALFVLMAGYKLLSLKFWTHHIDPQAPVNVTAVPVTTVNKPICVARAGSISKAVSVPVNAEYSGRLNEIYVTEGESVKAGQALFKLDVTPAAPADNTASPAVTINRSSRAPREVPGNYVDALKEYNRCKKLYELGAIPRRQFEDASARLQEAQKGLYSGGSDISVPEENAPATVSGPVTISAPVDGIVTGLAAASGKMVQAGQQLMALGSGQELDAVIRLEQSELYLVPLGAPVIIQVSSQGFMGKVSSVYPEIQENQIPSFVAHIKLTNTADGLLQSGMSANLQIDSGKSVAVPAVPKIAVFQDEQGVNFIYVAADGRAVRQQINVGEAIGDFVEITSNVPRETMVITDNFDEIKNGEAITIIE